MNISEAGWPVCTGAAMEETARRTKLAPPGNRGISRGIGSLRKKHWRKGNKTKTKVDENFAESWLTRTNHKVRKYSLNENYLLLNRSLGSLIRLKLSNHLPSLFSHEMWLFVAGDMAVFCHRATDPAGFVNVLRHKFSVTVYSFFKQIE